MRLFKRLRLFKRPSGCLKDDDDDYDLTEHEDTKYFKTVFSSPRPFVLPSSRSLESDLLGGLRLEIKGGNAIKTGKGALI